MSGLTTDKARKLLLYSGGVVVAAGARCTYVGPCFSTAQKTRKNSTLRNGFSLILQTSKMYIYTFFYLVSATIL